MKSLKMASVVSKYGMTQFDVEAVADDGTSVRKTLEPEALANLLLQNLDSVMEKKNLSIDTGILPKGTLLYKKCVDSETFEVTGSAICIHVPAHRGIILYDPRNGGKQVVETIAHPSYIYFFKEENGQLVTKKCFVVREKEPDLGSRLYRYPFGNVSHDTGAICVGNVQMPSIEKAIDYSEVIFNLDNAFRNDDYYSNLERNSRNLSQEEWIGFLKTQEKFPEEDYMLLGNETISSVWSNI